MLYSTCVLVISGVAAGAVLGPALFNTFISDQSRQHSALSTRLQVIQLAHKIAEGSEA